MTNTSDGAGMQREEAQLVGSEPLPHRSGPVSISDRSFSTRNILRRKESINIPAFRQLEFSMLFSASTSIRECSDRADYAGVAKSLLIVEDHPVLAEYMEMVAEDLGWEVEVTGSAKEFKRKIEPSHPTVIALDLGLPDGDGVELIRHLSGASYKGAILIISGCDESVLETCSILAERLGLRVTGYVQKPLTAGVFTELLQGSTALE